MGLNFNFIKIQDSAYQGRILEKDGGEKYWVLYGFI